MKTIGLIGSKPRCPQAAGSGRGFYRHLQGGVLGCTEIGTLIKQKDTVVRLFDTTVLHAKAAAQLAMAE